MNKKIGTLGWVLIWTIIVACSSLGMWAWQFAFPLVFRSAATTQSSTSIGDQSNVLIALFTLLAFIGLLVTIYLQKQDLDAQRKKAQEDLQQNELKRREDGREAELQQRHRESQEKEDKKYRVRSEVLQLLAAWQQIVHNTKYGGLTGRDCFHHLSEDFNRSMTVRREGGNEIIRTPKDAATAAVAYHRFYSNKEVSAALGHYFRLLYHIIRYMARSGLHGDDKKDLVGLVRAHLSEPEFNLLFWNGLGYEGVNFKPLIDEYDLLQNFSFHGIFNQEKRLYPDTFVRLLAEGRAQEQD